MENKSELRLKILIDKMDILIYYFDLIFLFKHGFVPEDNPFRLVFNRTNIESSVKIFYVDFDELYTVLFKYLNCVYQKKVREYGPLK